MNKFKNQLPAHYLIYTLFCFLLVFTISCKTDNKEETMEEKVVMEESDPTIEIITEIMDFQSPDTIPSGWHTFNYINKSNETHFFLLDKYPEGKTIADTKKDILPAFDAGMDLINEGKNEEGYAAFNKLPAWFFEVVFSGGSGLVSPNNNSLTTVKLEPGYYIMECYVKMSNGKFHSSMGMFKQLVVTDEDSGNLPPEANVNITISSTEGINYTSGISKGKQIFSVEFKDQIVHENFVGHDVNLVKIDGNASTETLESWVNWSDPKGLITPAPEGFTFMGGINDSPAGSIGYFKANLTPGKYAFISEVPNTLEKGLLKTFTISE